MPAALAGLCLQLSGPKPLGTPRTCLLRSPQHPAALAPHLGCSAAGIPGLARQDSAQASVEAWEEASGSWGKAAPLLCPLAAGLWAGTGKERADEAELQPVGLPSTQACCSVQLSVGTGPDLRTSGLCRTAAAQGRTACCLGSLMQGGARPSDGVQALFKPAQRAPALSRWYGGCLHPSWESVLLSHPYTPTVLI